MLRWPRCCESESPRGLRRQRVDEILGVRAGVIHDVFSAHQGVEDDDMNVLCLGGKVIGSALALELVQTFLGAYISGAARHRRRLAKVQALETGNIQP